MSEIDINKMVEKAKRRKQWSVSKSENAPPAVLDGEFWLVACDVQLNNATFIAQAPATILALHKQVQDLQAANAALQAQVGAWQEPNDVLPPMSDGYRSDIVIVATEAQYHYKENRWILNSEPFGWKVQLPDPSESPTAAESEE